MPPCNPPALCASPSILGVLPTPQKKPLYSLEAAPGAARELHIHGTWERRPRTVTRGVSPIWGAGGAWGGGVCASVRVCAGGHRGRPRPGPAAQRDQGGARGPPALLSVVVVPLYFILIFFFRFFPFYKTRKIHLLFFISPSPFPPLPLFLALLPHPPVFLSVSGEAAPLPSPQILGAGTRAPLAPVRPSYHQFVSPLEGLTPPGPCCKYWCGLGLFWGVNAPFPGGGWGRGDRGGCMGGLSGPPPFF